MLRSRLRKRLKRSKVGKYFYARKKILPVVLNQSQVLFSVHFVTMFITVATFYETFRLDGEICHYIRQVAVLWGTGRGSMSLAPLVGAIKL